MIIFLLYLIVYAITIVPTFPPLPASIQHPHQAIPIWYGSCIHVLWLIPAPPFIQPPTPSDSCCGEVPLDLKRG